MAKQTLHHARYNMRGNISSSIGTEDRMKAVKTKSDGRLHPTLLDIYPILKSAEVQHKKKIYPESIIASNDGSSNNVNVEPHYDHSTREINLQAISNGTAQDIDLIAPIHLPKAFKEWYTTAISGSFLISDQSNVSLSITIVSPENGSDIFVMPFGSMTKTVIGPGPIARVDYTIYKVDLYSLQPTIKFGLENGGIENVYILVKPVMNTNHWTKLTGNSFVHQYYAGIVPSDIVEVWDAPTCTTCDGEDCTSCNVCDGEDE